MLWRILLEIDVYFYRVRWFTFPINPDSQINIAFVSQCSTFKTLHMLFLLNFTYIFIVNAILFLGYPKISNNTWCYIIYTIIM